MSLKKSPATASNAKANSAATTAPAATSAANMGIGTFRKNVMKTINVKPTKLALKETSKNTNRTTISQLVVALNSDIGKLLHDVKPYVLGLKFTQSMKDDAFIRMGDIAYEMTALCRVLKVKMPTTTKKVKLVGTRTAALMDLATCASDMLQLVSAGAFTAPPTRKEKKMVTLPSKEGKATKEEREVLVVDKDKMNASEKERQEAMAKTLTNFVDTYWKLTNDMFGQPPAAVIDAKFARMQKQYPNVEFDLNIADDEDEAEASTQHPVQASA